MNELPFTLAYHRCRCCGRPVPEPRKLCHHCQAEQPLAYRGISAPYLYEDAARAALLRFKKERYQGYASVFAEHMAVLLTCDCPGMAFDLAVSAPPRRQRMKKDGYDQAAHLAKTLAKKIDVPYAAGVLRQKESRQKQSSLSREERFRNIRDNIKVMKPEAVLGKRVLLVDDICTTGATLGEASRMLKAAGAREIYCSTAAIVE